MEKLIAIKKDGMNYTLKMQDGNKIELALEFFCEEKFEENDALFLNANLINQNSNKYSPFYTFGKIDSKFGKNISSQDDKDFAKLEKQNGKTIMLKRIYG